MNNHKYAWIDLEMTGLDAAHDRILEIALIITDEQLNIIHKGPALVINQPESVLGRMNEFVRMMHTTSGLIDAVRASSVSESDANQMVLDALRLHGNPGELILAGNSVWQDRLFLQRYMPELVFYLHYRMVDVSTLKVLVRDWYASDARSQYKKKDTHRALEDIEESIAELRYYRSEFFR